MRNERREGIYTRTAGGRWQGRLSSSLSPGDRRRACEDTGDNTSGMWCKETWRTVMSTQRCACTQKGQDEDWTIIRWQFRVCWWARGRPPPDELHPSPASDGCVPLAIQRKIRNQTRSCKRELHGEEKTTAKEETIERKRSSVGDRGGEGDSGWRAYYFSTHGWELSTTGAISPTRPSFRAYPFPALLNYEPLVATEGAFGGDFTTVRSRKSDSHQKRFRAKIRHLCGARQRAEFIILHV